MTTRIPADGLGWTPAGPTEADPGHADLPPPARAHRGRGTDPLLLVTRSGQLHEAVARIAAAADRELLLIDAVESAPATASTLLIDVRALSGVAPRLAGRTRREVIILAWEGDPGVWQAAAELGVQRVAVLPDAAAWLVEHLRPAGSVPVSTVIGIAAGCGGAGATTTACWLAQEAAADGPVLLLDADPCSAGLDAVLGSGRVPGLRWRDLHGVHGSINPEQLATALPRVGGFGLLSGETGLPPAPVVDAVLEAARAAAPLVVVDLGRTGMAVADRCDAVAVVVQGSRRALPAAAATASRCSAGAVIVRGPLGEGLDEVLAAEATGLPLAGYLPFQRRLDRETDSGRLLAAGRHHRVRPVLRAVLAACRPHPAAVS